MRIATWNVNSLRARLDLVRDWLVRLQPDLVCLQETKVVDELFPAAVLAEAGYRAVFAGERTYNGVAILSLEPLDDVRVEFPLAGNVDHRLISGVSHGIRFYSAYFPNGRAPDTEHFFAKLRWIEKLGDLLLGPDGSDPLPVALLGDFNVAPEPGDVFDPVQMEGRIHFTAPERAALTALGERGLVDAFRVARAEPGLFSWWDYRQGAFRRNLGLRIDHVWTSPAIAEHVKAAFVDIDERRKPSCSDHAPVVVDLDI
ncbi:MAG: exodeoxyribonuclease III [Chloroflexi bacterium]|nr:exodeoxyribonuclease III [Chloroflexota bacterium]